MINTYFFPDLQKQTNTISPEQLAEQLTNSFSVETTKKTLAKDYTQHL